MSPSRPGTHIYLVLLFLLSSATATVGATVFSWIVLRDGLGILDIPLVILFAILFLWIAIGFWTATFGLIRELAAPRASTPPLPSSAGPLPRTAIIMPIYNEDVLGVYSGLAAIHEDVVRTGQDVSLDFFVLSDTTDPDIWLDEEEAWAALRVTLEGRSGLFYRRRTENISRKCGNIRDFCQSWGANYRYMVVLDADSLLTGSTILRMVQRMEEDDQIGILQSTPVPVGRRTFFARLQQFSAHFYGPMFTAGYALWSQMNGNYWGHNAIIRIKPFMECCGLPTLPGAQPLGGEILSHDFAEAAFMRKGGWKVIVDHELPGSYEACPTNLIDFAKRDQRWCQGNLQHIRLAAATGLRAVSRTQLGMGAMSYLSSPLTVVFLILTILLGVGLQPSLSGDHHHLFDGAPSGAALCLFVATMSLLLLPKFWALLLALRRPAHGGGFGGPASAVASVVLETACSILLAPILMVSHTAFVVAALVGHSVRWDSQARADKGVTFTEAMHVHAPHTIAGLFATLLVTWFAPGMLIWASPALLPLVLSVPLSMLLSSRSIGNRLLTFHLLAIPEEIQPPQIILRREHFHMLRAGPLQSAPHPFIRVVLDPKLNELHRALLPRSVHEPALSQRLERLRRVALAGGQAHLSKDERMAILRDASAIRWLHQQAWRDWPVDIIERCAAVS